MRLGTKLVVAAVALGILASPTATDTVLDHAHDAFASVRQQASAELSALRGPEDREHSTLTRAARPGSARSYKFTVRDERGRPGRWNPCQAVPIIVNRAQAPAHAMRDLRTAVKQINRASGLGFKIVGTTTARPTRSWGTVQWSGRSGWAPVLIAFGAPGTGSLGRDGSSGVASPVWVTSGSSEVFVSGAIVFNSRHNHLYQAGFRSPNPRGELFVHELGHLAGLDHVNDPTQVMYPETGHTDRLGAGDLAGLRALGSGGCVDVPSPSWG